MKRRLYFQVYLGFLIIALFSAELTVLVFAEPFWTVRRRSAPMSETLPAIERELPPVTAPPEELQAALDAVGRRLGLDLAVWKGGVTLASTGAPLPAPNPRAPRPLATSGIRWIDAPERTAFAHPLLDGRWLVAARAEGRDVSFRRVQAFLLFVFLSIAIGSFPVARRITRRLERLQKAVEGLGAGELSTRVEVEGEDEVAELARRFNLAAERIESLVDARRRMLASASHELRTPLTRVRVRLELLAEPDPPHGDQPMRAAMRQKLLAEAEADIQDLDTLIGDLLLTGRLEARAGRPVEPVEVFELLAAEAGRFGVAATGQSRTIQGDRHALRRMIRNLLDNARRHGGGRGIEASVEALDDDPDAVRIVVADRGPGVREQDRERIFEPFYRPAGYREGTDPGVGLGLALVQEIARYHGGEARCLAREGGGTRFEVELRGRDAAAG